MFNILSDDKEIEGNLILWSFVKLFTSLEKLKQASAALTYHTLFAIVPIMAMLVAVAKLMGYGEMFRETVEGFFEGQEGIAATLLSFAESYLHNAQVNYLLGAGVGLVFLIYSLFSIFQTVDDSFNSLWNLKGHGLKKQLKVFVFILLVPFVGMILLAMWLSVSSYISSGGVIHKVNVFLVLTGIYVALMFLAYKFIPNTKVEVRYAARSAIACGIAFGIVQYFGFMVMSMFSSYRNIYGDMASLVLFILWIYFSWTICLAGSRWNYLLQEGKRLDEENRFKAISHNYRKFLTLLLLARCEEEALEDKDTHLIAGAAVTSERCGLGLRAMAAGKDYFTDKAPFTTLDQLASAKKAVADTGRKYMVYYSERLHVEGAVMAGYMIDRGEIGRVLSVSGFGPHRLNAPSRPAWFFEKEKYGGILCDIGSHQIEQYLYFAGEEEAKVTLSRIGNYANPDHPELDDFGDCMITGEKGTTNYFRVDWFTPDGLRTWGDGRTFILGTEGYIEIRKYIDVATEGEVTGNHVILVNGKGEKHINATGVTGYPFFGELILDCLNRTENAMTQAHAFKAAELCVTAQNVATELTGR